MTALTFMTVQATGGVTPLYGALLLEAGTLGAMTKPKSRSSKTPEQQRITELEREVARLEAESARKDKALAKREEALEVLGKGVAFLEALSKKDQQ